MIFTRIVAGAISGMFTFLFLWMGWGTMAVTLEYMGGWGPLSKVVIFGLLFGAVVGLLAAIFNHKW